MSDPAGPTSLALGQALFERFNEDPGGEAFWELTHPDIVLATDPRWPGGGEFHGADEYRRFMAQFLEAFEGIRFQEERPPEVVGDWALFHGRWVGLGAASGIATASAAFWAACRARDGLIAEARFFFDETDAREAVSPT